MIKILPPVAVCLVIASSSIPPARAQSLGDAAKKAQEERAKAGQGTPGKVFTNKDVGDAPAPPVTAATPSTSESTGTTPARNRLDPLSTPEVAPVPILASDGKLEVQRVPSVRGSAFATVLSLVLRGVKEEMPASLVLRAVHEDRLPVVHVPFELDAEFVMKPSFVRRLDLTPPHVVFIAEENSVVFSASVDAGQRIDGFSGVAVPIDLALLTRLGGASRLRGRLFDMEFVFTPGQLRLLTDFSQRARKNPLGSIF